MKIVIRQTENLEVISKLDRTIFPYDLPLSDDDLQGAVWWLASDDDGYPVAFAGVCMPATRQPFMIRAGVRSSYRGLRLQRRLIRVRYAFARRMRAEGWPWDYVYTYVAVANLASQRSLISCGFLPYYWERDDQTYLYFKRDL